MVRADYDYLYLDCGRGGWVGFEGGLNSWCDPFKTWHHAYS
jgi:hexosaminidase